MQKLFETYIDFILIRGYNPVVKKIEWIVTVHTGKTDLVIKILLRVVVFFYFKRMRGKECIR
ncbi:MAG: hypothetical protein K0S47_2091 [Herbinix sp.]|jgi:hypothetical protein|nr:hypothetical protein [Herbinix sp.]